MKHQDRRKPRYLAAASARLSRARPALPAPAQKSEWRARLPDIDWDRMAEAHLRDLFPFLTHVVYQQRDRFEEVRAEDGTRETIRHPARTEIGVPGWLEPYKWRDGYHIELDAHQRKCWDIVTSIWRTTHSQYEPLLRFAERIGAESSMTDFVTEPWMLAQSVLRAVKEGQTHFSWGGLNLQFAMRPREYPIDLSVRRAAWLWITGGRLRLPDWRGASITERPDLFAKDSERLLAHFARGGTWDALPSSIAVERARYVCGMGSTE